MVNPDLNQINDPLYQYLYTNLGHLWQSWKCVGQYDYPENIHNKLESLSINIEGSHNIVNTMLSNDEQALKGVISSNLNEINTPITAEISYTYYTQNFEGDTCLVESHLTAEFYPIHFALDKVFCAESAFGHIPNINFPAFEYLLDNGANITNLYTQKYEHIHAPNDWGHYNLDFTLEYSLNCAELIIQDDLSWALENILYQYGDYSEFQYGDYSEYTKDDVINAYNEALKALETIDSESIANLFLSMTPEDVEYMVDELWFDQEPCLKILSFIQKNTPHLDWENWQETDELNLLENSTLHINDVLDSNNNVDQLLDDALAPENLATNEPISFSDNSADYNTILPSLPQGLELDQTEYAL